MKTKNARRSIGSKKRVGVRPSHALVGTWKEEGDPSETTQAVFTVAVEGGRFHVSGVDESDGVVFRITDTRWDGERLRFTSMFPTTNHRAKHVFQVIAKGRISHQVSYSDEDGDYVGTEVWKKRKQRPQ